MRAHPAVAMVALTALALSVRPAAPQTADSSSQADANLPTVAVMDFDGFMMGDAGNSVNLGKAVTAMLVTEFSGRPGLRVIERQQLNSILTEQKISLSGRVDESTALEVGKMLGVQYMLLGQVSSIADQLRMDIRVANVETSQVLEAMKMVDKPTNLLKVVVAIADDFSRKIALAPRSEQPPVRPIPIRATIELSRALDYEDQGDTAQAIDHYRKVLEIDPDHQTAQAALARLQKGSA